jgi:hypothetical protein
VRRKSGEIEVMKEPMVLNEKNKQKFMDLCYDFFGKNPEMGVSVVCLNETDTDSEHVHRLSIFIRDKDHNPKDLRWADEVKRYLEEHFPEEEQRQSSIGLKLSHSSKR